MKAEGEEIQRGDDTERIDESAHLGAEEHEEDEDEQQDCEEEDPKECDADLERPAEEPEDDGDAGDQRELASDPKQVWVPLPMPAMQLF